MAISTYKIFLMMKKDASYEKLIDIKDFPDLGGAPEMLETTTLSDKMQTYIPGIQSLDALEFTANYTKDDFEKEAAGRFPVEVINMVDYGRMNAAGIIDHCVSVMG